MKRDLPEPIFGSTHEALRFGFNASGSGRARTVFERMMNPAGGGESPMGGPLDRAAQAGMVLAEVAKLPVISQSILMATYGDSHSGAHCPLCSAPKPNGAWRDACSWLVRHIGDTALARTHTELRHHRALVAYFLAPRADRPTRESMARLLGVDPKTAGKYIADATRQLKRDHSTAFHQIDTRLQEIGLVPDAGNGGE